jgi:hypothetical protein
MKNANFFTQAICFCILLIASGCWERDISKNLQPKKDPSYWKQLPGKATDIGVGSDGTIHITGTGNESPTGGYAIYKWVNTEWKKIPGAAVRIAVDPQGDPWVVNKSNLIFRRIGETWPWQQLPGTATDIGIGAEGSVYITSTTNVSETGGYSILKWTGSNWNEIPGAAVRIAVDPQGDPWVVNKSNLIFRRIGETWPWQQLPGTATDIGIGADGTVYIVGATSVSESGGYGIFKWTGASWEQLPGAAINISVDPSGKPYFVDKSGNIFTAK